MTLSISSASHKCGNSNPVRQTLVVFCFRPSSLFVCFCCRFRLNVNIALRRSKDVAGGGGVRGAVGIRWGLDSQNSHCPRHLRCFNEKNEEIMSKFEGTSRGVLTQNCVT